MLIQARCFGLTKEKRSADTDLLQITDLFFLGASRGLCPSGSGFQLLFQIGKDRFKAFEGSFLIHGVTGNQFVKEKILERQAEILLLEECLRMTIFQ